MYPHFLRVLFYSSPIIIPQIYAAIAERAVCGVFTAKREKANVSVNFKISFSLIFRISFGYLNVCSAWTSSM